MKIRSTSGALAALLEMVSRAVSPRSMVPLLQAVLFEAKDGVVTMSATDMEISMSLSAEVAVDEEGRAAIPARLLLQYAKSLPEGEVELSASEAEATLACGKSSVALRCYSPEDFPTLPTFPEGENESFEVDAAALPEAIGKVLPFVSKDESRPVLTGVLVAFADAAVRMVATDSYRLGLNEQKLEGAHEGAGTAILSGRALKEAARLAGLAGEKESVGVVLTENQAMFRVRGLTLSSRLIDGTFPEYKRLIPDAFNEEFYANRAELLAALKRVRLVAGNQNPPVPVRLAFSHPEGTLGSGEITISLRAAETGAATEVVSAEVPEGKSFEVCFNPVYLADAVASLSSEKIALRFNEPLKPAVLQASGEAGNNDEGASRQDGERGTCVWSCRCATPTRVGRTKMAPKTDYQLSLSTPEGERLPSPKIEEVCEFVLASPGFEGLREAADFREGGLSGWDKRWEPDDDLLPLSRRFPNVVFTLRGQNEEDEAPFKTYYLDGGLQHTLAELRFEPFDPTKLMPAPTSSLE